MKVTMKGNPLTLVGNEIKVGDKAPNFEVVNNDLEPVKLSGFSGKVCVVTSVPSLDTGVCDVMARRFNSEAKSLGDDVDVLVISMDLPFAQSRWCGNSGAGDISVLSDHRSASFGENFGVLVKELRLLGRAVFVLDSDRVVKYAEIVEELTNEPDYEKAIEAVKICL